MKRLWIAGLLAFSAAALAQPPQGAPPPPEVKRTVDTFAGTWSLHLKLTPPGAASIAFPGTWHCQKIAGGTAVDCTLKATAPGLGPMEETDLIGYDPETKAVHIMTWNNQGEVHDHHGGWQGDKIVLHHSATAGGKPVEEDFEMTTAGTNKMSFRFTSKTDEGTATFEGEGTRKPK
ncbi:MAG TPA: hypothetical protein VF173_14045 [Thermoanaerobaculia bacterium]|nr:hypothetical protein [Thermoanaerobaculia bacterium]